MEENKILAKLILDAADGKLGAVREFYQSLLQSKLIYIKSPLKKNTISIIGDSHLEKMQALTITQDGIDIVPVFSEKQFAENWLEDNEYLLETIEFSKLIWSLGQSTYLHLNPGQDVGKEITPWEIELLKSGEDALDELVADYEGDGGGEITVKSGNDVFKQLQGKLLPILEIYPELEEAFLVSYNEEEDEENEFPLVGIKYKNIEEKKRKYIREEIANAAREFLPEDKDIVVVDDLENINSPNHRLFIDVSPFYISSFLLKEKVGFLSKVSGFFKRNKK